MFREVQESSFNIIFPLLLLALGSIFVGYLTKEVVLINSIPPIVDNFIKIIPFVLSLLGIFLPFFQKKGRKFFYSLQRVLYTFFNSA